MLRELGRAILSNPFLDGARMAVGGTTVPGSAPVVQEELSRPLRHMKFRLTDLVVSVAAANDYGSQKLCDLPTGNVIVVGAIVDITGVVLGFATNTGAAVDLAIGSVATASTTFANAGEKDIVPKIDGTGTGTTSTIKGATTTTEKETFLASGAKALYVNVSDPVTTGTGTLTLSGIIDLFYIDMGAPA